MSIEKEVLEGLYTRWNETGRSVPVEGDLRDKLLNSLSVEDVGFLKPHEETHIIGKLKVAEGILRDKRFTWPIFSDRKTGVILDGMHRWGLLKDFCFHFVPVQYIDYLTNDQVQLDVWCRVIKDVAEDVFQLASREVGLEEVPYSLDRIKNRTQAMMISPNDQAYIFDEKMSPQLEYKKLKGLEDRFGITKKVNSEQATYAVEDDVLDLIGEPRMVRIFPRPLSKRDVLDVALTGEVFPPKTTRHIFQYRIFNIEVLPDELQDFKNHELLAQKMRSTQRSRRLMYIGKGISIDRYYEEHMFRFD